MKTTNISTTGAKYSKTGVRVVLALTLALCLPATAGCGLLSTNTADAAVKVAVHAETPATVSKGVVLDSTTSTDSRFCESVRDCLVSEVSNWGGASDNNLSDGAPEIPALSLWVFPVGDNPVASYSSTYIHVSLPSVTALGARPTLADDDTLDSVHEWNLDKDRYAGELAAWQSARDNAVAELQAFDIYTYQWSGVLSTLAAVSSVVEPGADILLASDLENNQDAQVAGSLQGSKVYALQPTPSGDMAYADELYAATTSYLLSIGVVEQDIFRYRDELTPEAVKDFMYGIER
jgi:hypothetical protein